jgi:hypothetical protein
MSNQHYAVVGRFHGDDEATALAFEAASRDEAVKQFKEEMCALRNLEPEECKQALSDTPVEHIQVYVDAVFRSDSKIEEI